MNDPEQTDDHWIVVGSYASLDEAQDRALVALAMGEAIRVEHADGSEGYDVFADPAEAPKIFGEIRQYEMESCDAEKLPYLPASWRHHPVGFLPCLAWAAMLLVIFRFQTENPSIAERFASSSTALIGGGEWWRPFTALFLHADGTHIIGNLASGALFGMLVSKSLGPWKGWLMILLAGTVGNAITSLIMWPEGFRSLGASTSVFGALGILSGTGIVENFRENIRLSWLRVLAPLLAGFILLGWLGGASPGEGVDVFGHVFGFCAGVFAGAACRFLDGDAEA